MKISSFKHKINSYFNNNESKLFDGLVNSSDSLFLSLKNTNKIIIAENNEDAERIRKEILLSVGPNNEQKLIFIPGTEELPYDMVDSDKYLSSKKNLALIKYIKSNEEFLTIITTVKNLQKKIIPLDILKEYTIELIVNDTIDIKKFKTKLTCIGYINNPQVNFIGEFSIRGSIIDIFPGGYDSPIRIDLDDIKIDTIKKFDTDTQITYSENIQDKIYIVPINNIIVNEKNIINFRKRFREIFEGNPNNNEIYTSFSNNIVPQGFNNFFPLLYENVGEFLDYFDNINDIYIFSSFNEIIDSNTRKINEKLNFAQEHKTTLLSPDYLYTEKKELIKILKNKNLFTIEKQKVLDSHSYNYNISSIPDISIKPYLEKPLRELELFIKKLNYIILVINDDNKLLNIKDILKSNKINYKQINDFDQIDDNNIYIISGYLKNSFKISDLKTAFINDKDILKDKIKQQSNKNSVKSTFLMDQLKNLDIGSPVVHDIHGVGRYNGLQYLETNNISNEYLTILYDENDKLYVPVSSLHLVNKYNTSENEIAPLHKLGGFSWSNAKKKATKKAYDIAAELLEINAKRALKKIKKYDVNNIGYEEFCNDFIYDETEDQQNAINDVLKDLQSEKLMDRLICGDVGFGKTEIALRAAFICVSNYKQVVLLAPTTLLAEQHEKTFKERFEKWPINIKCLSRFKSKKDQEKIIQEVNTGECNILIGTHRVIQKDIKFKSLGLLIIDEEQKFGVKHKEFLKKVKNEVNVLTLTATPIPRTLNMSLGGLRDLSIIATSPENRIPIKTYISNWENSVIKEACDREINRGGQIFFIHNRINDIDHIYNEIQKLMPSYSIKIAHAQMSSSQLEKVVLEFYNKKFNILLSTTIIENGIDISNANTIIINKSDKFGLSQLHQIRGRVGRGDKQAYCYLMVHDKNHITENAKKRLQALESMEDLGSGFSIASRDLEIRGAGALLGDSQSGEVQEIGFSLYNRILSKAISSLKSGKIPNYDNPIDSITEIDINEVTLIPEKYINDINQRLIMYKKIANSETQDQIDNVILELINRFGNIPKEVDNLIDVTRMKIKYSKLGIKKLVISKSSLKITFLDDAKINHDKLIKFINNANNVSFSKDNTLTYKKEFLDIREKKIVISNIIESIK